MAVAAATSDGGFAVVYMPSARTVTLDLTKLGRDLKIEWFDPTNGATHSIPKSITGNKWSGELYASRQKLRRR